MASAESRGALSYQSQMSHAKSRCVGVERAGKTKSVGSRTNCHCESRLWPLKLVRDWKSRYFIKTFYVGT